MYLPAHHFVTKGYHGKDPEEHDYNLVDGGLAANNPVSNMFLIKI